MSEQNTKSAKTIFFVWNYIEWGGVQIYFLGFMRSVARRYAVKAILPENSDAKILQYLCDNQIEYEFFPGKIEASRGGSVWRRVRLRWNDLRVNFRLARHLAARHDLKNSIIQIDVAPWYGFFLLFYLALKTKVFVTFHTALPELSLVRRALLRAKFGALGWLKSFHIAASNADVKKSLLPYVGESSGEQIEIVYSSVNLAEIERASSGNAVRNQAVQRYGFPPEKIWVCCVAQFIERKGCWIFLEAARQTLQNRDDVFFFWLGTAQLPPETLAALEKYDLGDNFRFLSAKEIGARREDLLQLWRAADIFALPSFQEGLPVALVEAMALGKACVASNINAIPEALRSYETGILIEPGNPRELAAAVAELVADGRLRQTLGANARLRVAENFDEKKIGAKMLRLYDDVMAT